MIYFGISVILGILEIFAVSQGIVGIRGVFSNKFLAMSKKGKLHASVSKPPIISTYCVLTALRQLHTHVCAAALLRGTCGCREGSAGPRAMACGKCGCLPCGGEPSLTAEMWVLVMCLGYTSPQVDIKWYLCACKTPSSFVGALLLEPNDAEMVSASLLISANWTERLGKVGMSE